MTIQSKISATELNAQLEARFVNQYFEVALLNASGVTFDPGVTNEQTFISTYEIPQGSGGYRRQVLSYEVADLGAYADQSVSMATKTAVFTHDGTSTVISFTHAVLMRGDGNVLTFDSANTEPTVGNDGTYSNIPTTTTGSGIGLTVDITVTDSATTPVFTVTPSRAGYGYSVSDLITISESALVTAGVTNVGGGNLVLPALTVTSGGQLVSVSPTNSAVALGNGNEAVLYFNVKQFGYGGLA